MIFGLHGKGQSPLAYIPNRAIQDSLSVESLIDQGDTLYNENPELSLELARQAAAISDSLNYQRGMINSHKLIGISNWILGNYNQALSDYQTGLEMARSLGDSISVSIFLIDIGVVFSDIGDYENSLHSYLQGLKILESTDKTRYKAVCLQNIGEVYKSLREFDNATEYNNKALRLFKEINDDNGIAVIYNNNSDILIELGQLEEAFHKLNYSRDIFKKVNNARGVSVTTNSIGKVLSSLGQLENAEKELLLSVNLKTRIGDKYGLVSSLKNLGSLKMKQGQLDSAGDYFKEALKLSQAIGSKEEEIAIYRHISSLMEQQGQFKNALHYHKKFNSLKDSVFSIEKNKQIVFLQTLYDTEKRNKENIMLKKNQVINEQRLEQQKTKSELYAILLLFAFIIFSALGYAFYQKIRSNYKLKILNQYLNDKTEEIEFQADSLKEANKVVQELNQNLESKVEERTKQLLDFSFKNSHEIRGPLSRILGLINLYKEDKNSLGVDEFVARLEKSALELDMIVREINNILHNQEFKNKS